MCQSSHKITGLSNSEKTLACLFKYETWWQLRKCKVQAKWQVGKSAEKKKKRKRPDETHPKLARLWPTHSVISKHEV